MTALWMAIPSLIAAAAILGTVVFYRQARRLRRELSRLELRHLRSQINPHFLFNTLNAISELGYNDPGAADRTITRLGKLLRESLDTGARHEISLKDELDILRRYLDIQQTLLQNRLKIDIDVAPETLSARVPSMILQPLAENAITHGITSTERGGAILISAHRAGEALIIEISDNGPGVRTEGSRERIGLTNTRTRLARLYGNGQQFELLNRIEGGATARLRIPFHEAYAYDEDSQPYY